MRVGLLLCWILKETCFTFPCSIYSAKGALRGTAPTVRAKAGLGPACAGFVHRVTSSPAQVSGTAVHTERGCSGCGFSVSTLKHKLSNLPPQKSPSFTHLPKPELKVSLARVDCTIKLHHQLSQEKHWAINLGSNRHKFHLGNKEDIFDHQILRLDLNEFYGVGFRNFFNAFIWEHRMEEKQGTSTDDMFQYVRFRWLLCQILEFWKDPNGVRGDSALATVD